MGNEVSKKYNLSEEHNATAGHCQLWKIYPGHVVHKDKVTKTDVSVWIFMRDGLAKREPVPINDKSAQEQVMQIMKKDMSVMKEKDMQHPGILKVLEVAEDSRKGMAFVTERIVYSLADLLSRFELIPGRYNWHTNFLEPNATITDMEVSYGFHQLAEALQYLHTVRKKLHMNVSPENIVLTPGGVWKLCGFGFSLAFANDENKIAIPYYLNPVASKSILLEPDLKYMGQEMSEPGGTLRYAFPSSDVFSLGVVIYEAYRYNLQLAKAGRCNVPIIDVSSNNVDDHYHRALKHFDQLDYSMIPQGAQQILRGMLQLPAHGRIGNIDVINNPFFHSGALAIMRNIGSIASKDIGGQASTLTSLPSQICDFPPRLLENFVLPVICKLGCKDSSVWKYSLPLYVFISTKISAQAYARAASSSLIIGLGDTGAESLAAFVAHTDHFLEKLDKDFFTTHVVKMLCNAMDKQGESSIQGSAISVLTKEVVFGAIGSELFLNEVVPKVCRETCKNTNFEVKLKGLYFLSVVAKRFDSAYVSKNILPSLKHVLSQECTSELTMAVVGVYCAILPSVGADMLATNVIPTVMPILVNRALNKNQFQLVTDRITLFLQGLLTFRTNELGIPAIDVRSNEPVAGNFFKEDFSKSSSNHLIPSTPQIISGSNSFKGTQTLGKPPPLPSKLPPSVPSNTPPPVPSSNPPPIPSGGPPPIPGSCPPPIPSTANSTTNASPTSNTLPVPSTSDKRSSWFGMSKSNDDSSSSKSISSDTIRSGSYVAPYIPPPSSSSVGTFETGKQQTGMGMTDTSASIDMDDFLSSFHKPPGQTMSSPPPTNPSMSQSFGQVSAPLQSNSSTNMFAGMSTSGAMSGNKSGQSSGDLSIEDQIRNTQAEIARLSGSLGVGNGSSNSTTVNHPPQQNSVDIFAGSFMMNPTQSQQQSPQMYQNSNSMQQQNMNPNGMVGMQQGNFDYLGGMSGGMMGGGWQGSNSTVSTGSGGFGNMTGMNSNNMSDINNAMGQMNSNVGGMNNGMSQYNSSRKDDPFDFFN